ncbi:MAG: aspartate kinase [Lachnospiraceae bacterium]|mgnify:CR=1 FL=1|jgi:aspartate kinase|nr:aspartate kinase [Lachnospiraceae bacterium]MCI7328322.1 aspartate kinase [Lachnospiraceae bacterium]MDD7702521.1 aspartate kinase [Lachnospiraceae bacterium]MDY3302579.1 aspartate kinase [Lachnospiraceae bacterium]MEE3378940.1 aspartate kinase [Lachnospiraceae bacterium]
MKKVVKFGGSSLADAKQFKKAGDIVRADATRLYVVPSAPGKRNSSDTKVTDMLIEAYRIAANDGDLDRQLADIKARYDEIITGLGLDFTLDDEFEVIADTLKKDPYLDYAASRGEYLNGKIMAKYLGFDFVDPFDTIFFNEEGSLNTYKTEKEMKAALQKTQGAVVPGFYGRGKDGRVKTFSRGGSDVTGSIVAAAASVDVYENWTDVSGFLVADPRIVKDPVGIDTITYRELRELSYMGASVLHEDAIFPVRSKGIPINIKNTNRPQDEGTWIVESTAKKSDYTITGIAGKKGFCACLITKGLMNSEIGFGRKVLQSFEDNGISFEHMPSGIDTMTVVVHEDEFLDKEQQVVSEIHRFAHPDSIEIESDLALIAVVGRGMKSMRGTAGRIFSALAHRNVNVRMIDQGSSELNIIIGVANQDFETAIEAIYDIFVNTQL